MAALMRFISDNTVAVLAVLCIPVSGVFLTMQREKLRLDKAWKVLAASLVYVIFGLLSLVIFSVIHDIHTLPHWSIHHQGLLIVFPLFFPLFAKWLKADFLEVSDALSVPLPGIIAIIRVYCLIRGCDYGRYIPGTQIRWPVREGVIFLNFACCAVFLLWNRRGHAKGLIFPVYLMFYGAYRIVEVHLRYYDLPAAEDYVLAILSILAGLFILMWVDELQRKQTKRIKRGR